MTQAFPLPMRIAMQRRLLGPLQGWEDARPREGGDTDGGWTVFSCKSRQHRLDVMQAYPTARMPCWRRIESGEV